jgi:hypothetical protein
MAVFEGRRFQERAALFSEALCGDPKSFPTLVL